MIFWVIFGVGVALTIAAGIGIRRKIVDKIPDGTEISNKQSIMLRIVAIIFPAITAGIITAKTICWNINSSNGIWYNEALIDKIAFIVWVIIVAVVSFLVVYWISGLYNFSNDRGKKTAAIWMILSLIISGAGWSIPIAKYNKNIEVVTATIAEEPEERQLLYFCNIPVQNISGKIGKYSGNISTTEELPYWYASESNEALYDTSTASKSKIIFIEEDEIPKVEITSYTKQTKTVNHNNGKEKIEILGTWEQYVFYLPEEIMQYELQLDTQ